MKKVVSVLLTLVFSLGLCCAFAETPALPAYVYPYADEDPLTAAVANYLVNADLGYTPEAGGVLIPAPIVLKTEMDEEETEATVYGNFWIFAYKQNGKILECTAGGENPGIMKLEKKDGTWTVVSLEVAEEGEDSFRESIRRFAGGDAELEQEYRVASDAQDGYLPQFRRAFVLAYVNANALDVEAYQDFGWDPVSVTN